MAESDLKKTSQQVSKVFGRGDSNDVNPTGALHKLKQNENTLFYFFSLILMSHQVLYEKVLELIGRCWWCNKDEKFGK